MSDTKPHAPSGEPIEHDAINFGALGWSLVILAATVLVSQVIVWGLYEWYASRMSRTEAPRSVMAAAPADPAIEGGRIVTGTDVELTPGLLVGEPAVLRNFLETERREQREYGWVDQGMGVVRLPIERAKALVLERGLPVETAAAAPAPAAADQAGEASTEPQQ